jgi:3-hydroxybutyryl-CoA dehydrogenase
MEKIKKVIILGSGEAGEKIRDLFSQAGLKVVMLSLEEDYIKGLADADLVLDALSQDMESRKEALRKCDEKAPAKTVLATTASSGITELAGATKRPQKFIGLNFTANPLTPKYLVQMTKGLETSEETLRTCRELVEEADATAVELEDSPGLILDRVVTTVINEAASMHMSKLASVEDIDKITKLCLNWPMGPFEFADTLGVDNVVATLEVLSQQSGQQYLPCRLLRQMVASGRLGKKTGKGFYTKAT